jgi:RNA polymerase sigma-70 factor (ECF subfamily)
MSERSTATALLARLAKGDQSAADELLPLVYEELKQNARNAMCGERPNHTLQPTAVVHEAYLKLIGRRDADWEGRSHFLAVATLAMKNLLVDHARARGRQKRGGDLRQVSLCEIAGDQGLDVDLLDLHDALEELHRRDERQARVVELRYFGGATNPEIAELLGVALSTVGSDWTVARAWLRVRLGT